MNECAHLDFHPCAVSPFGILRHAVCIRESFDPHFYLASIVKNTTVAIHKVGNGVQVVVLGSVAKNSVVPALEVRVVLNEGGECIPLVGGRDKAGVVRAQVGYAWAGR